MSVSIIIKALNEEQRIAACLESAIAALASLPDGAREGEIILADAGSSDRTVAIAARFPVRIVELSRPRDRGCGTGPQLGFQYARCPLVCLIDGDMTLAPRFLAEACAFLDAHPDVAGVSGEVQERNLVSLEFQRRQKRGARELRPGPVDRLNGGGLYRRVAIDSVGHFSDRNLHGYEEFDLAVRLRGRGWTLHRLPMPFVDHYGHVIGGYRLLQRRFQSGYICGIGEVLRGAIGRPHFRQTLRDLPEIRLWFGVYAGWLATLAAVLAAPSLLAAVAILCACSALPVLALSVRERSLPLGLYAFVSWNAHAVGLALGLARPRVPPEAWIASREMTASEPAQPVETAGGRAEPAVRATVTALVLLAAFLAGAALRPARAAWVPVRDTSLAIVRGSPLDFSGLFPMHPAGSEGRVVADSGGHLAFSRRPDEPVRFLCASLAWSPASGGYPDHAAADVYAEQLRLHGYNAARFHFLDANLMGGRTADFDYDPVVLDRFRYLLAALKRNGIYWVIDAMTSPNGALGNVFPDRWVERHDLKLDVYIDPIARQHWHRLVATVLGTPDPYTGATPLADPALALVVLVNENGLPFDAIIDENKTGVAYPAKLAPAFNDWLQTTYGSRAALAAAWPDLRTGEDSAAGTVALPARRDAEGPRMRDLQRFFHARETETTAWMSRDIRALGYPGLVTAFNNTLSAEADSTRALLPVISADTYHDEVVSLATPATISQTSSLADAAGYARNAFAVRWLDRPFVVTEYDHLFWNRFRHEAGAVFPAYAALQGWDLICRHAFGAIDLDFDQPWPHKRAILPYDLGLDPVGRASETLAALLFRRGDVAEARGTVAVPFGRREADLGDGRAALPDDVTALGLVSRFGLTSGPAPADAIFVPWPQREGGSALTRIVARAFEANTPEGAPFAAALDRLRAAGRLDAANRTDAAKGVFQSDTGQITLDRSHESIAVVTPRTEAASFAALPAPQRLGALTIEAASGPALVAISALDGATIARSHRLLVIFATDAGSTGMVFRDGGRRTVEDFGRMPVLIEHGTARLRLATDTPASWRLSSLHLDGAPGDRLPVAQVGQEASLALDNTPSHGPTTFFLLER